ncbi:hypothetical protein [Candidatus Hecatella orcuttiae]|uniref:hypothetical protein n=1 Tax=Candidatus Hecatella orcuttiae TaxID=1935119 RepID=UPI002867B349|nr:hypothetical protein [Candidatus Hecatella orcuttiae]
MPRLIAFVVLVSEENLPQEESREPEMDLKKALEKIDSPLNWKLSSCRVVENKN